MMHLLNFSHPLNEDALGVLREKHRVEVVLDVPFHLDVQRPIVPQVKEIVRRALDEVGDIPQSEVAVIPPGYAPAAMVVAYLLPAATFIRLAAEPGTTPPKWMPVEAFKPLVDFKNASHHVKTWGQTSSRSKSGATWTTTHSVAETHSAKE